MQGWNVSYMVCECSIRYFKTKNLKENSGLPMVGGSVPLPIPHTSSAPAAPQSLCLRHLPSVQKSRSATGFCNGVGYSADVGSISWKMTWSGSYDSDLCSGSSSGCCLGRLSAQRTPESLEPSQTRKSMASPIVELAEMEGGHSAIGLLVID